MNNGDDVSDVELEDPARFDWSKATRGQHAARGVRVTLKLLREAYGKTQVELARAAGMNQRDISKLERRGDHLVSILRAYIQALGGEVEIVATFSDHRFILAMPDDEATHPESVDRGHAGPHV
ncbi:MAG: helix-turn-helix transcriptional regulator [Myxococcales bacterium]|jgi:transcriptional regulator with XRE-family HTH domain